MTMETDNSVTGSINNLIAEGQIKPKQAEHKTNLDAADFQKLFLEQLTHQDPMQPMSQQDMMQQLATLMELSRNNESNDILKSVAEMTGARNRMVSGSLIGKHVTLDTHKIDLRSGVADIKYNLPKEASNVTLQIYQGSELVKTIQHDIKGLNRPEQQEQKEQIKSAFLNAGVHSQSWNGMAEDGKNLPDGTYSVVVRAGDAEMSGMPMQGASASMQGWVKAVNLSGNQVTYKVGTTPGVEASSENAMIKPDQITEILPD